MESPVRGNQVYRMRLVPIAVVAGTLWVLPVEAAPSVRCEIVISEAPDDVRRAIDGALAEQTTCGPELVIRVVVAERGFFVEARDTRGRVRARVVPDAPTVGVLVASWATDDRVRPDTAAQQTAVQVAEPSAPAPMRTETVMAPPTVLRNRWLTVSGTLGIGQTIANAQGLRVDVDLVGSRVALGVAASVRTGTFDTYAEDNNFGAVAYLAFTHVWERWRVRGTIGGGAQRTELRMVNDSDQVWASGSSVKLATEASATIGHDFDERWSMTGGLLVTVLPAPAMSIAQMSVRESLPQVTPQLVIGLSRRL